MLYKFFLLTAFTTKYDTITLLTLSGSFLKILLQSVTNRESFTNFQTVITKCDKKLLQSGTGITKCDRRLLQSVTGITKCGNYQV